MTSQSLNRACGVDVLAKIRAACDSDALPYGVYAAVAELIQAAEEMNRLAKGPVGGVSVSDKRAIVARVDAALSAVEGKA